ncbi:hypothetical protein SAMN02745164_01056 [Marinitoga hydrogenitolerans DSM 16785]|uniref:Uncharacterized protein n=1 Tax=Marinitoga hydrogenitolerans (strain DSM 16785 / JCM 12826 / AT1271) TaxID=1122195 RepID=A0A1M4VZR8_MARH1|nr:hypothetical protein [Marinitoga hydrogenitolerans]SHE74501.1 hypothetical protein SAMN02745164_01056 [Marinitoga hydrogenitolerans DSM 16785]
MKIYGMVIVFSITILLLSIITYFLFGKVETKIIIREPIPTYSILNFHNEIKDDIISMINESKNLAKVFFVIEDLGVFIGKIRINYSNNHIFIAVVNNEIFDELKTTLKSFDSTLNEYTEKLSFYGLQLNKNIAYSKNFTLINYPTIAILDLSKLTLEELSFLKLKYFVMDSSTYQPYSFKTEILEKLKKENGIILDSNILRNPGVQPLLNVFVELGINVIYDMKVYTGGIH